MSRSGATSVFARPRYCEPLLLIRENRFAHSALSRLNDPASGRLPRLVFLYGPSGVGKSHLIRQHVREQQRTSPTLRTICVTGSQFAAELAAASQNKSIDLFHERFRSSQLVVFEDIGLLRNRPETQRQLTPILDEVLDAGGQALLSAERLPGEYEGLSPRIVSRCHAGACAEIAMPEGDSRVSLLRHFSATRQFPVPDEVIQLLAARLPLSPRELFATVVQLDAYARMQNCPIDVRLAEQHLNNELQKRPVTLGEIARVVARHFGLPVACLRAVSRKHGQLMPRQVAMWLARELTDAPLRAIGEYFGRRNHATVLHACRRIGRVMEEHAALRRQLKQMRDSLNQPGSHP